MSKGFWIYVWVSRLLLFVWFPNLGQGARDCLKPGQLLSARANDTVFSAFFTLGFFSLTRNKKSTQSKWYAGIWYSKISQFTLAWVANRERPLTNISSAVLNLTAHGILVLSDNGSAIWPSSGPSRPASYATLRADGTSFDEPGDTLLPGMMLTGNRKLTAWASEQDPTPGPFQLQIRDRALNLITSSTSEHGDIIGNDSYRNWI